MDYDEALKKVQATKPKENHMAIRLSYGCSWLLPWKDGLALMAALSHAEQYADAYGDCPKITTFDPTSISVTMLPPDEYQRIKIAALLGVKPDEVKQFETPAQPNTPP